MHQPRRTYLGDLCDLGWYISDESSDGQCRELKFATYYNQTLRLAIVEQDGFSNKTINDDDCPVVIQLAETEGCCAPLPTYDCNVCGNAAFYGTCGVTLPLFNGTSCALYTPDLARICCATPSEMSSSAVPSSAPQELTTLEPGASSAAPGPSSPMSESGAMWSTSNLVSLMGLLAIATTAEALLISN